MTSHEAKCVTLGTSVSKEGERGYNPGTPSNIWNNPKIVPLDDMPT